ncbi:MAG: hypothetical protein S4CHLAM7_12280 [Chlamydiae bacterium]|nr:hypothetical protein [Chlamydiota bacterium]
MSISIDSSHLAYFRQNHQIEFENLLKESEIRSILTTFKNKFDAYESSHSLQKGFDLWREHDELKPIITSKRLAKVTGQLMETEKLRFGFSQFISSKCYSDDFSFLYRKSCIKDFTCGLCICLKPSSEQENPFFPTKPGNGIIFEIDTDFYLRYPKSEGAYLFILYTHVSAIFLHQMDDPLNIFFRELGYENGDRLKETLNPSFSWMLV